jgi:23S rRNA (cytidine1920-2'-O)/16S rRNA (cytidine1409-2'-O)-methyltransferase
MGQSYRTHGGRVNLSDHKPHDRKPEYRRGSTDAMSESEKLSPSTPTPTERPTLRDKQRLDLLLVEQGLVASREQARRLIMAGDVLVNETVSTKPGHTVDRSAALRVRAPLPYVSRGGQKLAAALAAFPVTVTDLQTLDVGASTGGFTDCLLQAGAARVYAVDVGYGQLAWKLRTDPRVVVLERTNIRKLDALPDAAQAELAVIDASFISLALVLPPTLRLLTPDAGIIALIKPQFEAGQADVGKGGVVRDAGVHRRVLDETVALATTLGLQVAGLIVSPLLGPAGNVEFLVWLVRSGAITPSANVDAMIEAALTHAATLRKQA